MNQNPSRPRPTDLGFGMQGSGGSAGRMLRRNGQFNVDRRGFGLFGSLHVYHSLLTMPWKRFVGIATLFFLLQNLIFALIYLALGSESLASTADDLSPFFRAFFFSVETISTIGYGNIVPVGVSANVVVTAESFFGILLFALITGLVFARFARPVASIVYSEHAIIAPYEGGEAFEFRVVNGRTNQLIDVRAQLFYSHLVERDGRTARTFQELRLERTKIAFFALSWTIVHPIDETSPLHGVTREWLLESDAEFLVLIDAVDETFSQPVYSRSSYKAAEVILGARFVRMFENEKDGGLVLHKGRLNAIERVDRLAGEAEGT